MLQFNDQTVYNPTHFTLNTSMQSEPDTEWIALPRVISIDDWHEPDYIRIARIQISLSENPDMPRLRQLLTGLRENLKTRLSQRQIARGSAAALEGGHGIGIELDPAYVAIAGERLRGGLA